MKNNLEDVARVVERFEPDGTGYMFHINRGDYVRYDDYADLQRQLAEVRAGRDEFRTCLATTSGKLMAAEARAKRGYQALLDAHYHDERDLTVVIEVMAAALDTAKGAEK